MLKRLYGALDGLEIAQALAAPFHLLPVAFICIGVKAVEAVEPVPGRNLKARLLQPFFDAHGASHAHLPRAGAAADRHARPGAVERHAPLPQRQRAVVFQQHHALRRGLARQGAVFLLQRRRRLTGARLE